MGKKRRYITGLDGIRAIAVIMVLAYHLKLALFKSGFLGVTVFFVLSGYLITGILISEVEEEGTIDLKNFWLRRIRRLVPAVMSMAVVIIFVSAVVNRIIFTKGCKDFLASVLGFNNWWQIFNKVSYFEAETCTYAVPHTGLLVKDGEVIEKGTQLTYGALNPHEVLRIRGNDAVYNYLIQEVLRVYRQQCAPQPLSPRR